MVASGNESNRRMTQLENLIKLWRTSIRWMVLIAMPLLAANFLLLPLFALIGASGEETQRLERHIPPGFNVCCGMSFASRLDSGVRITSKQRSFLYPQDFVIISVTEVVSGDSPAEISIERTRFGFWFVIGGVALCLIGTFRWSLPAFARLLRKAKEPPSLH